MRRRRDAAVSVEELERRQRRRGWVVGIGIIFGFLMLISTLYGTFLTHQVVASHNTELTQIKALSTQIAARQQDHSQTLHKIAALTEQLNADKAIIARSTLEGLTDYQDICNAIQGCLLQFPVSTG
jgi:hypothetical protein